MLDGDVLGHLTELHGRCDSSPTQAFLGHSAPCIPAQKVTRFAAFLDQPLYRAAAELEQGLVDMQTVLQKRTPGVSVQVSHKALPLPCVSTGILC
eukprot:SAG22_NODE_1292_length_4851_cov_4.982323_5_plen_95_part_00